MKSILVITGLALTIIATDIATPAPAVAGWCIEACGLVRQQRRQTRETVCTTVRRGNSVETVCTSN
jgi:hypothetical protein